jgi:hypothetical protein
VGAGEQRRGVWVFRSEQAAWDFGRKRGLSASFHAVPLLSPERKLDVVAFRRQLDEQE